jgi:hypothetical protein
MKGEQILRVLSKTGYGSKKLIKKSNPNKKRFKNKSDPDPKHGYR